MWLLRSCKFLTGVLALKSYPTQWQLASAGDWVASLWSLVFWCWGSPTLQASFSLWIACVGHLSPWFFTIDKFHSAAWARWSRQWPFCCSLAWRTGVAPSYAHWWRLLIHCGPHLVYGVANWLCTRATGLTSWLPPPGIWGVFYLVDAMVLNRRGVSLH